jgi:L-arabinose isomerase
MTLTLALAQAAPQASVQKVRIGQTAEKVRIVFDMTAVPNFNVTLEQEPLRLLVDIRRRWVKMSFVRSFSTTRSFIRPDQETEPGQVRAISTSTCGKA